MAEASGWRGIVAWSAVVSIIVGLGLLTLGFVRSVSRGEAAPYDRETYESSSAALRPEASSALHLAGSGTNIPLTRALAVAFTEHRPEARVVVHESLGSTGGILAAADGAIDLGLVSRPFTTHELEFGLRRVPYARVALAFCANPTVPVTDLSRAEVLALYAGERAQWPNGLEVVVLQREAGDSGHKVAAAVIEGFAEADRAALEFGRWPVLYRDRAMQDALLTTSGAIGLFDQGAALQQGERIKILRYAGIAPSEATVLDGSYPLSKELAFVVGGSRTQLAGDFLSFVESEAGRALIRANGYIPLSSAETKRDRAR